MNRSGLAALAISAALSLPTVGNADGSRILSSPDGLRWMTGPPSLPPGVEIAVLLGDPRQSGPYILRVRFPDNTTFAPHSHRQAENVTVLAGGFSVGIGPRFDPAKLHPVRTGGFFSISAGTESFGRSVGDTVIEVAGMGPFDITYVNPQDDPAARSASR